MRLGAWLCANALLLTLGGACSGGYSLPPTPCDDWCHVTQDSYGYNTCYSYYDPANCVSQCESQQLGNRHCTAQFQVALACYRDTPGATTSGCYYDTAPACFAEYEALITCAAPYIEGYRGLPSSGGEVPIQE